MNQAPAMVFIIDDDEAVRVGIDSLLRSIGLSTALFASSEELMSRNLLGEANCLVLDVRLPGLSGLEFQRELNAQANKTPIIFITGHGDIPMSVRAMKAGAVEFLMKPFREQDLLDAVQHAIQLDRERRREGASLAELRDRFACLTVREREVMESLIAGHLNKQIGEALGAAESTIKAHRGQVMRKMQAHSLPHLVRMGDALGIG